MIESIHWCKDNIQTHTVVPRKTCIKSTMKKLWSIFKYHRWCCEETNSIDTIQRNREKNALKTSPRHQSIKNAWLHLFLNKRISRTSSNRKCILKPYKWFYIKTFKKHLYFIYQNMVRYLRNISFSMNYRLLKNITCWYKIWFVSEKNVFLFIYFCCVHFFVGLSQDF